MLDLNQLFSFAWKAQGIKQGSLARKVGIAQPSLSQFENGQATLSRKTLHAIAPLLNLNPEYIDCESENPFRSSELIRMFFLRNLVEWHRLIIAGVHCEDEPFGGDYLPRGNR